MAEAAGKAPAASSSLFLEMSDLDTFGQMQYGWDDEMRTWRIVGEGRCGTALLGRRYVDQRVRWSAKQEIWEVVSEVVMLFHSSLF